jgi:cytochrome c-type biogenesis protein CcmH
MTTFALFAALLLAIVLALLVPVLWIARPARLEVNRKETNLGIFRDQLAELEREKNEGMLAEHDYEQARGDLQRRLLEDVDAEAADHSAAAPAITSRKMAVVLLLAVPLLAVGAYAVRGTPKAIQPEARVALPQMTPEQINAMVERLAEKLKANPDDMQGWLMLGRSYKSQGRFDAAVSAFAKAEKLIMQEPDLIASYAETIALARGQGLQGKPQQLVELALKLDPQHPHSLFLAGAAAMEVGDNKKGLIYWEALLPMIEPGSDVEKMVKDGIQQMKGRK